jgi:hypothetical protein
VFGKPSPLGYRQQRVTSPQSPRPLKTRRSNENGEAVDERPPLPRRVRPLDGGEEVRWPESREIDPSPSPMKEASRIARQQGRTFLPPLPAPVAANPRMQSMSDMRSAAQKRSEYKRPITKHQSMQELQAGPRRHLQAYVETECESSGEGGDMGGEVGIQPGCC